MPSTVAAVGAAAAAAIDCSMTAVARSTTSQVPSVQCLLCVYVPDLFHVLQRHLDHVDESFKTGDLLIPTLM